MTRLALQTKAVVVSMHLYEWCLVYMEGVCYGTVGKAPGGGELYRSPRCSDGYIG